MGDYMSLEEKIIGKLGELSELRKAEVLDFVEYLRARGDGKDLSEDDWLRAASANTAFEFLRAPEEDIYTLEDGRPFNDQG
jgi:hypothetical protein